MLRDILLKVLSNLFFYTKLYYATTAINEFYAIASAY